MIGIRSGTSAPPPRLKICYLCGNQFGSASIGIHIPQCYSKQLARWEGGDPNTRGAKPKHPDTVNWKGAGLTNAQIQEEQSKEFAANLSPCPNCGRTFLPDRLVVHQRSCRAPPGQARAPSQGRSKSPGSQSTSPTTRVPRVPPVLPRCYLCGHQFGSASLHIHVPQCYLKKLAQWESADPSTRGQAPKDPSTVNWKGEGLSKDQQNDQQFKEFVNNLEPCPHCGRKFLAERLVVHLRSCKPGSSSKPVGAQRPTSPGALSGDSSTGGPKTPPEPGEPSSRPTKKPSPSARLSKTIPQGIDPKRNRLPSNSEAEVGIQCIQCGAVEYDEKAKFCRDCGRNLRAKNLPDPCPGCGELIIEGSSFCPTCGQPVAKAPGLVDERTPKKELHVESPSVRMAHCPACRALCDADGNFCDNCGAALGDTEPVATTTNTKGTASEVELYCTTCDEVCEIENAIFCEECGEKLIQRAKASGLNEKRSSVLSGPQPTPAVKKREKTVLSEPEIQEPPPKRSVGKPVNTARVPESSEGEEAPQSQLIECYNCGRKFCEEALGRHQRICLNTKKRPVFDVSKQRLKELEAAPVSKSGRGSIASKAASAPPKKDWKTESENLRKCLREARLADQIIKSGGDLRDLPPPSYSENPDYVQCPHCERRFAPLTAERHIPKCATTRNRPKAPPRRR